MDLPRGANRAPREIPRHMTAIAPQRSLMTIFTNALKTAFLLGLLMALCLGVGWAIHGQVGMFFGLAIGVIFTGVSYFFSAKIALLSVGAHAITREQAPELYDMTARLAERAGIPMPRLYYSPQPAPNAFATGRGPRNGVVCVTAGLMNMMTPRELEGVIAHELSHIKHRDILITTIAAIIAGAISHVSYMAMWWGMGGRRRDSGPLDLILMLATIILAPFAAMLLQMAISRSREYAADARGARIAGGPSGLISALKKLEDANHRIPMNVSPAQSSMFIVMPLSAQRSSFLELFRTHPPTEKRIAKLIQMLDQPNPYAA
jgi:heat shock protein HtpX